ncbi:MAG: tRNA (adenosine(37)-N6)-threonylcarbamoyltransferase complex ATPase subunit type 1 TsaE [Candidatus Eremiobacteraeota bacterium]|nr:tRNA (adenosine(37)-N6)-threonylcarbamoyltransferase complex ATPase subunit type 1 TsaE [Candidatus Eremiobacteraeota bacterium]
MERTFKDESEMSAFAADFARELRAGDVVALSGPLGAGKTTFIRAAVAARLHDDPTSSPTFTFWQRYQGEPPIDHLDLYRVDDPRDLNELGLEEAFSGDSIVMVEWWEKAPFLVPARRFEVDIEGKGDEPRRLRVKNPA